MIHQVWRARQLRPAWSASLASVVARTACLHRDLTIDRDHDAGESWITLLRDRTPWATSAPTCPMTDSDGLRGGPTVHPTSTELRHVIVPFSHPSEVYPQKDGRKVR